MSHSLSPLLPSSILDCSFSLLDDESWCPSPIRPSLRSHDGCYLHISDRVKETISYPAIFGSSLGGRLQERI